MKILLATLLTAAVVYSRRSCIEEIIANADRNVSRQSLQPCGNSTKYKSSVSLEVSRRAPNCSDKRILNTLSYKTSMYLLKCLGAGKPFFHRSRLEALYSDGTIKKIGKEEFRGLKNLKRAYLSNNVIKKIKGPLFGHENKLRDLYLKGNEITKINKNAFEGLSQLKLLDLSWNKINSIEAKSFSDLKRLQYLQLESNKLTKLHHEHFTGLKKVKKIHLKNNHISTVYCNTFTALKNIQYIDLSRNVLKKIHAYAFGFDAKDASRAGLIILVSHNKLTTLYGGSFCTDCKLLRIDASFNKISTIPVEIFNNVDKLEDVYLENNIISKLNLVVFLGVNKLKRVVLDNNNISTLYTKYEEDEILPISATLEVLSLNNNSLVMIKVSWFKGFPNLKELRLDENQIVQLEVDYSLKLPNKALISLSGNKLKNIPSNMFNFTNFSWEKYKFVQLHLNDSQFLCGKQDLCQISRNKEDLFVKYDETTSMCLFRGNRTGCESEWPMDCPRLVLKLLFFSHYKNCPLKSIIVLAHQTGYLLLRNRGFTKISKDYFHRGIINISREDFNRVYASNIDLSHNEISVITNKAFENLTWTLRLYLQHNKLEHIYEETFKGLDKLKELNISYNKITSIHRLSFSWFKNLERLLTEGNNLTRNNLMRNNAPFRVGPCECEPVWRFNDTEWVLTFS